MSAKNKDGMGRWRNLTIAFRVSPEENEDLNMRVRLSGLTKQDYVCRRCLERDVVVHKSPRVYKALKAEMDLLRQELSRLSSGTEITDELWSRIDMVKVIYEGMKDGLGERDNTGGMKGTGGGVDESH